MHYHGLLTGIGAEGSWLVEFSTDGTLRPDFVLIPVELMPGIEPV